MARGKILLLVTGGIAAYKSCSLTRLLVQAGFSVRVAMTEAAQHFVTPMTFQVLSGHPVATDLWGEGGGEALDHVEWARWADLVVAAPATANLLAKAATGLADDLITTLLVAYLFSRFRKLLSRPRVIPVLFKLFSLAFAYFAGDMIYKSINFFIR